MFSMMFQSSQLISECNSLCRFWSIKFSVIWVLGLGKILRRAFDCLDHLWHLNVFSNWDKALWADSLHPWEMSYLISLILRDFVLWFFFFLTGFVGSVKVEWNKLDNPSKPGSLQKGWNAKVLLSFLSGICFVTVRFFGFFACNCTSLSNLLFCFSSFSCYMFVRSWAECLWGDHCTLLSDLEARWLTWREMSLFIYLLVTSI